MKKNEEVKQPLKHHQGCQHKHDGSARRKRKNIWRNNSQELHRFYERNEPTHLRSWRGSTYRNPHHGCCNHTVNSKGKERVLKAVRKKQFIIYRGSFIILTPNFSSEIKMPESSRMTYLKCWRKNNVNKVFYIQQIYPFNKWESNYDTPRWKLRDFVTARSALQEMLLGSQSFSLKWKDTRQWLEIILINKELW